MLSTITKSQKLREKQGPLCCTLLSDFGFQKGRFLTLCLLVCDTFLQCLESQTEKLGEGRRERVLLYSYFILHLQFSSNVSLKLIHLASSSPLRSTCLLLHFRAILLKTGCLCSSNSVIHRIPIPICLLLD